eukprot:TRINITY_DN722_c0_g1_i14.p1 TRINITY_DN722_c0_g1~~TRINITY_DN722_c0_g1_i14.p1  ORF type:complete len:269 (-),score=65.05 TRINITY_DN722_c0_g1_i14:67-873(-)
MPFAQQVDKDRRSRMVTSSINQPARKGGNGSFGWGDAAEYGPDDVETCFPRAAAVAPSKVTVAPTFSDWTCLEAAELPKSMPEAMNMKEFPALSSHVRVQQPTVWGPVKAEASTSTSPPSPSEPAEMTESAESLKPSPSWPSTSQGKLRSGSVERFDAQHPRSQFARKPRRSVHGSDINSEGKEEDGFVVVDWSSAGTTGVSGVILQQNTNAAHVSPYAKPEAPVALSVLKHLAQFSTVKQLHQQPQNCKHSAMGKRDRSRNPRVRCR